MQNSFDGDSPTRFNVRDAFEVYAGEKDPAKIDEMISRARVDLRTLQMLSKWDSATWAFGVPRQKQEIKPNHASMPN